MNFPANRFMAYAFVFAQLACLVYFVLQRDWLPAYHLAKIVSVIGMVLGLWAIWSMRNIHFSILPLPHRHASLHRDGPYRVLRHPMYSAQLLLTLGWILTPWFWTDFFIWLVYVLVMMGKISYEEQELGRLFPEYEDYRRKSYALLPFLF
jgi:protein-S-isoprenylcysteine O-methyltransferase Ste14